jgi:hypothetical protein
MDLDLHMLVLGMVVYTYIGIVFQQPYIYHFYTLLMKGLIILKNNNFFELLDLVCMDLGYRISDLWILVGIYT